MTAGAKLIRVAIGIVAENDLYLVTRRLPGADLPGLWEFPGGKIEADETPPAAAVRELWEELGIAVDSTQVLVPIEHTYDYGRVVLYPVLCRRLAGEPRPIQCSEFRWLSLAEIAMLPLPAANATLIKTLSTLRLQFGPPPANVPGPDPGD